MSDFRSIAAVTATLTQHIQNAVNVPGLGLSGTTVTSQRPDNPTGTVPSRVNVFLFETVPNAAFRSADTPTRRVDGSLVQRPRAALELHYLISCYGDDTQLRPQVLLGVVIQALHAEPVLTAAMITSTIANPLYSFLRSCDLANEVERVRLTPMPLSLEELSRIWSVLFQIPYSLSVAYRASVVFVDHPQDSQPAPLVLAPSISVRPTRNPAVMAVTAQDGGLIVDNAVLLVTGERLRATSGVTRVLLTGDTTQTPVTGPGAPPGASATDAAIRLPLARHPGLGAGAQGLQVIHYLPRPDRPTALDPVFSSDVAAFVLHPRVTEATRGAGDTLTVTVNPPVRPGQTVQAELVAADGSVAYIARGAPPGTATATLTLHTPAAPAGTWRLRARIDGAESPLPDAPQVTFP